MKKFKWKKVMTYVLIAVVMSSLSISNCSAAVTDKLAGQNIGVEIKWFDSGKQFKNYYITRQFNPNIYSLTMTNATNEQMERMLLNGKGEVLYDRAPYEENSSSSSGDLFTMGDQYIYMDENGMGKIDRKDYLDIANFNEGYATVTTANGNKGVIDKTGTLVFTDNTGQYKGFTYIGEGIFAAEINSNSFDLLDSTGRILSDVHYEWLPSISEGIIRVQKNGLQGFLDLSGNKISEMIYEEARGFKEGFAAVCKGGKWGYIDKTGREVIAHTFEQAQYFDKGLAMVAVNNQWGLIDKEGKIVLSLEYGNITEPKNGLRIAQKGEQSYLINTAGEVSEVKDYSYYDIDDSGQIYVGKTINGLDVSAYLDANNNMLTGFKDCTLSYLSDQLYFGRKSGDYPPGVVPPHDYSQRFALFDAKGNNLTGFKYSNMGDFHNNFQVVYKYYYDGAGLVNQYGAEVLPTVFDQILLTDEGYAFVTIADNETGDSRVGVFKIPEQFSDMKRNGKPITVYVDGVELYFETEPVIINERVLVPMRKIFETIGAEIAWDNKTKTVTGALNDKKLSVTINSKTAYINGTEMTLDSVPFIQDDFTLVPLRFVAEALDCDVQWDGAKRRVIVTH